jgi:mannose-6-phosphate isomerase-like protein (cupin superfamily)
MTHTIQQYLALACLATAIGCASTPGPATPLPVVDALLGSERVSLSFDSLASRSALSPDSDFRVAFVGSDERHSHHVVSIRHAESPHRHDRHDLLVVILKGHGEMLIGTETRPVGAGSILYIPRHTRHAFTNESGEPATAYAIYTPPFDGVDRVAAD